jgi:hypothetical protein
MKQPPLIVMTALLGALSPPAFAQTTPATPPNPGRAELPETPPARAPIPAPASPNQVDPAPEAPASSPAAPPAPVTPVAPTTPPAPAATAAPAAAPAATPPPAPTPAAPEPASRATKVATRAALDVAPSRPLLGLALATPNSGSLPGRFQPSFGVPPRSVSDWKFDFHGYMNVPFRVGVNEREDPLSTQYKTVLHGKPFVADDYERFEHTGTIPEPWIQLGFSYGNSAVVATIIVAARSASNASGYFDPPTQLGINDAFITFKPNFKAFVLEADVGAFANRYGSMGEYDTGRYDMLVIAQVSGVGETVRAEVPLGADLALLAEQGIMGQWDRPPLGVPPAGWNDFADSNVGTSFANHIHAGLGWRKKGQLGLHYINAWTHDDRNAPTQPDGAINVIGADIRGQAPPFGRFYLGVGHTMAERARGVSGVIRVMNTFGGPGLMREYLGPRSKGTGTLTTLGAQYDLSLGEVLRGESPFAGYGPDIFASVFGMFAHVTSEDTTELNGKSLYDGVDKLKYGAELTYSALPWFGVSGRYDRVISDLSDASKTMAILSPRIFFRTDYNSRDQVTLQYSYWMNGSGVVARTGYKSEPRPDLEPDAHTFSLTATMWW